MPSIGATFRNDYGQNRKWVILDTGRDPNSLPLLFSDYLDPGQATAPLNLYSSDGIFAQVTYQRSDGAPTIAESITDASVVSME